MLELEIGGPVRVRHELKAIAMAIVLIVVFDLLVGVVSRRLTADAQHIESIPAAVEALGRAEGRTVLFLGNSVTRAGVDLSVFEGVVPPSVPVSTAAIHPDDTTIADWIYVYDHFVVSKDVAPDLVVVPFVTGQLRDDRPSDPSRIGRDYTSFRELIPHVTEMSGLSPRIELAAAYASNSYGNRERLARRGLDLLPRYRELVQGINDEKVDERDEALEEVESTYHRLERLRDAVGAGGGRLVVVAMPTRFAYSIDDDLERATGDLGVGLIDLRAVDVGEGDFADELHLNDSGAAVVARALSQRLLPML